MLAALLNRDLCGVLRLVRDHTGWTQTVISGRTGISQSQLSPIMAGRVSVQSLERMERIAEGLGMPDDARMTLGLAPSWARTSDQALDGQPRCTCGRAGETGECTMHRRHFLGAAGSALSSAALVDPAQLADVVRRRHGSNVDDLTLDDLELTVDHLVKRVPLQSHHELFPLAARNWAAAEQLLDGWQGLGQRRRLVELAGQLAYFVGHLHFSAGRYAEAGQFTKLTQRYAAETKDLVLRHSAVLLHSSVAFYGGNHRRAVEILERGDEHATQVTRAEARACAARSYSAMGNRDSALAALQDMQSAITDRPAQGVQVPFTEGPALLFTTACRQRLGDGPEAVATGREAVAAFGAGPSRTYHAHSRVALALALATGDRPVPDEATALGGQVMDTAGPLAANVVGRLVELRDALQPWVRTPQVAVFGDGVAAQERLVKI
jgi:tetratricopeptide (TPR) repeat protein